MPPRLPGVIKEAIEGNVIVRHWLVCWLEPLFGRVKLKNLFFLVCGFWFFCVWFSFVIGVLLPNFQGGVALKKSNFSHGGLAYPPLPLYPAQGRGRGG